MPSVRYKAIPHPTEFRTNVEELIRRHRPRTVCDLGGGANPVLSENFVAGHGLRYIVTDASQEELDLAPAGFEKLTLDIEAESVERPLVCDLAISRYVLEHVAAPERAHRNIHAMVADGGRAMHFFSTLYSLPFAINRVIPHTMSERLAALTMPEREIDRNEAVFPAHYRWCRGPTRRQLARLRKQGFEIEEYIGYFGHSYFRRMPRLQALEYCVARRLAQHPVPALTSFAQVVLVKPS